MKHEQLRAARRRGRGLQEQDIPELQEQHEQQ